MNLTPDEIRELVQPGRKKHRTLPIERLRESEKGNSWYAVGPHAAAVIEQVLWYATKHRYIDDTEEYNDLARRFKNVYADVDPPVNNQEPREMELSELNIAAIEQALLVVDEDIREFVSADYRTESDDE